MKKQLLALSIIAALSACSDDETTPIEQTPAEFSGEFSGIATKALPESTGFIIVNDVNARESLVFPATTVGQYGTFAINAAGEWTYTIDAANEDVIALVSSAMESLTETFTFTTVDGSTSSVDVSIDGIDVPALISGALAFSVATNDNTATGDIKISDANPAEAKFKPAAEQPNAIDVDGVPTITTMYGTVTLTVTDPIEGVAAVEAVEATETTPAIAAVEAVKAVPASLTWVYNIDPTNADVLALNYEGELEAGAEAPSLDDTFLVSSVDGTEQVVTITVKGSQLIPANITGIPGGIDVAAPEGQEPIVNPIAEVNVGSPVFTGKLEIEDPNFGDEIFQIQETFDASYGSFSLDDMGAWTYTLDVENPEVSSLKGDGINLPTPLTDTLTVKAKDGTEIDVQVFINGLLGGNLAAKVGGGAKGLLTLLVPEAAHAKGSLTFKALNKADKDVKFNPAGNKVNDDWRTAAMVKFKPAGDNPTGAIQFADGLAKKFVSLDQSYEADKWFDVVFTWDNSSIVDGKGAPIISLSINGTPVSSADADFFADTFASRTLSQTIATNMKVIDFEVPAAVDGFYIDNLAIYADGVAEPVFYEDFDELSEGTPLDISIQDPAKTEGTKVGAMARVEAE